MYGIQFEGTHPKRLLMPEDRKALLLRKDSLLTGEMQDAY